MEMFLTFGRTKQERLGRFAVLAMCLLVLVFSFAAKLSLYQPKSQQIRALASSKMWQHEAHDEAAVMASSEEPELASLALVSEISILLLAALVFSATLVSLDRGVWLQREAAIAVRQQRFARRSQLRAPPVL
jgi:cell division protein FtsL